MFRLHWGNVLVVMPQTYLFWRGGRFIFVYLMVFRMKGRGGAESCAPHSMDILWSVTARGPAFEHSLIRGRSRGRSVLFPALAFMCASCSSSCSSSCSFLLTLTLSLLSSLFSLFSLSLSLFLSVSLSLFLSVSRSLSLSRSFGSLLLGCRIHCACHGK